MSRFGVNFTGFLSVALLGASFATASAATVSVDLPQLRGVINYGESPLSTSFDAGTRFKSIDSITVEFAGRSHEGTMRIVSPDRARESSFAPPIGVAFPKESGFYPSNWASALPGAWRTEFILPKANALGDYFDHLLDGQGEIMLYSRDAFVTIGFETIEIVEPSQIEITQAAIVITGSPIPEPGSAFLMLTTAVSFIRFRR